MINITQSKINAPDVKKNQDLELITFSTSPTSTFVS